MVIGSDVNNALKTKNYLMRDIKNYVIANIPGFDQNNLIPETMVTLNNFGINGGKDYDILIQEYLDTVTVTVIDKEIPFYRFYIINDELDVYKNITLCYLWRAGKGIFVAPNISNIIKISSQSPTVQDVENQPNTVTIALGVISVNTTFVAVINTSVTPINLSDPLFIYLINFTQDGISYFYKFKGVNGIYGATGLQCTINDFDPFILEDVNVTKTSQLINDGDDETNPFISLNDLPSTFPPSSHTHPISDIVGLQSTLDNKSPLVHPSNAPSPTETPPSTLITELKTK